MAVNAEVFQFLLNQQRDTNGIVDFGTATFYEVGTTTLKTVWLDRNKSVVASNPYSLSSNGTAKLYGDGIYRIVLKDSASVIVDDIASIKVTATDLAVNAVETLTNYAALKAITGQTVGKLYRLLGRTTINDGGEGEFYWSNTNHASDVTGDTEEGLYVPPTSDATGASGSWIRRTEGDIKPAWFGAVGDGVNDDTNAIQGAFDNANGLVTMKTGAIYKIIKTIYVQNNTIVEGNNAVIKQHTTFESTHPRVASVVCNNAGKDLTGTQDTVHYRNLKIQIGVIASVTASPDGYCTGLSVNNTKNSSVDNCSIINSIGNRIVNCIDINSKNDNLTVSNNYFENITTDVSHGGCVGIRNTVGYDANNIVFKGNSIYKNGPEPDELMWVNGAGGETKNILIDGNTFTTGATDQTSSALTIYRFTNSGALLTSVLENVTVVNNTFNCEQATFTTMLLGFTGDTDDTVKNVIIENNTFELTGIDAITMLSICEGVSIKNNYFSTSSATYIIDCITTSTFATDTIVDGNFFKGKMRTCLNGESHFINNDVESVDKCCENPISVVNNTIRARQFAVISDRGSIIKDNDIHMFEYSGNSSDGGLHYVVYSLEGTEFSELSNNIITISDVLFGIVRTLDAASNAHFSMFDNHVHGANAGFQMWVTEFLRMDHNMFDQISTEINSAVSGYPAGLIFKFGHIIKNSGVTLASPAVLGWVYVSGGVGWKTISVNVI